MAINLTIRDGDDARPFLAHVSIPCIITRCPGLMQLNTLRADETLLQRPFNDGPFYRCNRVGCHYHNHPRGVHEFNSEWICDTSAQRKRSEIREVGGDIVKDIPRTAQKRVAQQEAPPEC